MEPAIDFKDLLYISNNQLNVGSKIPSIMRAVGGPV
jgi:hypothetical protein